LPEDNDVGEVRRPRKVGSYIPGRDGGGVDRGSQGRLREGG
jgi:hypothetical protein